VTVPWEDQKCWSVNTDLCRAWLMFTWKLCPHTERLVTHTYSRPRAKYFVRHSLEVETTVCLSEA